MRLVVRIPTPTTQAKKIIQCSNGVCITAYVFQFYRYEKQNKIYDISIWKTYFILNTQ